MLNPGRRGTRTVVPGQRWTVSLKDESGLRAGSKLELKLSFKKLNRICENVIRIVTRSYKSLVTPRWT